MTFEEYHEDPKKHNQFETNQLANISKNPLILFVGLADGEWSNVNRLINNFDSMTDSFSPTFVQEVEQILQTAVREHKHGITSSVKKDSEGKPYSVYCKN